MLGIEFSKHTKLMNLPSDWQVHTVSKPRVVFGQATFWTLKVTTLESWSTKPKAWKTQRRKSTGDDKAIRVHVDIEIPYHLFVYTLDN